MACSPTCAFPGPARATAQYSMLLEVRNVRTPQDVLLWEACSMVTTHGVLG